MNASRSAMAHWIIEYQNRKTALCDSFTPGTPLFASTTTYYFQSVSCKILVSNYLILRSDTKLGTTRGTSGNQVVLNKYDLFVSRTDDLINICTSEMCVLDFVFPRRGVTIGEPVIPQYSLRCQQFSETACTFSPPQWARAICPRDLGVSGQVSLQHRDVATNVNHNFWRAERHKLV